MLKLIGKEHLQFYLKNFVNLNAVKSQAVLVVLVETAEDTSRFYLLHQ